jgi:hypothetical protein
LRLAFFRLAFFLLVPPCMAAFLDAFLRVAISLFFPIGFLQIGGLYRVIRQREVGKSKKSDSARQGISPLLRAS